jgi:hypothetical protein
MHFLVTTIFTIIAIAATTSATTTSATLVDRDSNAQRLARGLPPRSPKFGRTLPGFVQARDNPTPAFGALRPRSSSTAVTHTGKIEVRASDGSVLGDVKNWVALPHINGVNFGIPGENLDVSFTTTGNAPFNILSTNPNFPAPFYVGISGSSATLTIGSRSIVNLANVPITPAGVPAAGVDTESAVWSFDPGSNELTVQYVNPDGSQPETTIAYDIRENVLFFTGDLDAYNFQNDIPASAVTFFLVPI